MPARTLSNDVYLGIKAAFRQLTKLCGGLEAAALDTRVGKSSLGNYGNVNMPDEFAPADVIADLEAAVGEPVVTRALAKAAGYQLVLAANAQCAAREIAAHELIVMATEIDVKLAGIQQQALAAAADGKISDRELDEQIQAHERLIIRVQRNHDDLCRLREVRRVTKGIPA